MRCKKCGYEGVNLYVRNGAAGKRWLKICSDFQYCKYCGRLMMVDSKNVKYGKFV